MGSNNYKDIMSEINKTVSGKSFLSTDSDRAAQSNEPQTIPDSEQTVNQEKTMATNSGPNSQPNTYSSVSSNNYQTMPQGNTMNYSKNQMNNGSQFGDFCAFRTMITPVLIRILFWILVVACIISGVIILGNSHTTVVVNGITASSSTSSYAIFVGIAWILFGPLVARIWCEFMIVFFRINETLTEIKNKMD